MTAFSSTLKNTWLCRECSDSIDQSKAENLAATTAHHCCCHETALHMMFIRHADH